MMKLIKIDVKNFGGLSDSEWKISSQLHVFYGPNEAGKSTIAAFIKQIMFGFHLKSQKSTFFENYMPLKKVNQVGGSLTFKNENNQIITLERTYTTSDSKKGNLAVSLDNEKIPENIFWNNIKNIDGDFYTDSFIFNQDLLANVISLNQGDLLEHIYYLGAAQSSKLLLLRDKFVQSSEKLFKTNGRKPEINQILAQIKEKAETLSKQQVEFDQYSSLEKQKNDVQNEIELLNSQVKKLQQNQQNLAITKQELNNYAQYQQLKEQYQLIDFNQEDYTQVQALELTIEQLTTDIKKYESEIIAVSADNLDEQAKILAKKVEIYQIVNEADRLQNEIKQLCQELEQIQTYQPLYFKLESLSPEDKLVMRSKYEQCLKMQAPKSIIKNISFGLIIFGLVGVFLKPLFYLLILSGLIIYYLDKIKTDHIRTNQIKSFEKEYGFDPQKFDLELVMSQIMQIENKRNILTEKRKNQAKILEQVADFKQKISQFVSPTNNLTSDLEKLDEHYQQVQQKVTTQKLLNEKISAIKAKLADVKLTLQKKLSQNKVKDIEEFKAKGNLYHQNQQIKSQIMALSANLKDRVEILSKLDINSLHTTEQSLVSELEQIQAKLRIKYDALAQLKLKLKELTNSDSLKRTQQELATANANLLDYTKEYLADLLAADWIQRGLDLASNDRFPKMLSSTNQYFALLTNGRYIKVAINDQLQVVKADGTSVAVEYLSRGTAEQLYFALKLAFVEQIADEIELPILIDDAFVNFDLQRIDNIVKLVRNLSAKTQVIVFTQNLQLAKMLTDNITKLEIRN